MHCLSPSSHLFLLLIANFPTSLFDLIFFLHSFLYLHTIFSVSLLFLFIYFSAPSLCPLTSFLNGHCLEGNTTQHYTTKRNTSQHDTTQHNTTQHILHNTTQHNTTQHNTCCSTQHTMQHNTPLLYFNLHRTILHLFPITFVFALHSLCVFLLRLNFIHSSNLHFFVYFYFFYFFLYFSSSSSTLSSPHLLLHHHPPPFSPLLPLHQLMQA